MARIAGVDLPKEKRVEIGLTYIYGIGLSSSQKILKKAGVNPDTRVKDLTDEEENAIRKIIDECYEKAKTIIADNKALIMLLSDALMKYETLTKEQIEYIVENGNIDFEVKAEEEKEKLTFEELKEKAKDLKIKGYSKMNKEELEDAIYGKEE